MTLVELIISIVIIGIAAAALYSAMAAITGRSADPMLRQQSLMIAEAYLEEILQQAYWPVAQPADCAPARACFNDVMDYRALGDYQPPQDMHGNAIGALERYGVRVLVDDSARLNGVAALRVDVLVRDPQGQTLRLSGWRTCYGEYTAEGADACTSP